MEGNRRGGGEGVVIACGRRTDGGDDKTGRLKK
jgi:hypothetical protein